MTAATAELPPVTKPTRNVVADAVARAHRILAGEESAEPLAISAEAIRRYEAAMAFAPGPASETYRMSSLMRCQLYLMADGQPILYLPLGGGALCLLAAGDEDVTALHESMTDDDHARVAYGYA